MPARCESVSPHAVHHDARCVLNAGHSGAHTGDRASNAWDSTWLDPIGAHEPTAFAYTPDGQSAELDALAHRLEVAEARGDALFDALNGALQHITKVGGYVDPTTLANLRAWRALLAEDARMRAVGILARRGGT